MADDSIPPNPDAAKAAKRAYNLAYRAANRERLIAADAARYAVNRENMKKQALGHYAANRDTRLSQMHAYRAANLEREKARYAKRRALHADRDRASRAAYNAAHREERRLANAAWRAANPGYIKARYAVEPESFLVHSRNRKARKIANGGRHTPADIEWLLQLQKRRCAECKRSLRRRYHVDHVMPLSLGGSNDKRNLQILCATCNVRKHAKHPIDFARSRGRLL